MEERNNCLSVVLPAYNEEAMVPQAARVIGDLLKREDIPYELIFVNDGSRDGTWAAVVAAAQDDPWVRGVSFSRNFGKEAAILAGLAQSRGGCCAVIDCDLQHPPEKLVEMYRLWEQGYEIVEGVKEDRGAENPVHTFAAGMFYGIISKAVKMDMSKASDFKLLDRKVVSILLNMRERNTFFRALSAWVGFRTAQVPFSVRERTAGETKWSLWALVKYALTSITAFSAAPMQLVTALGVIVLVCSAVLGVQSLWKKFSGQALEGFTTVILLLLFIGSIIMISLGIIGYYLGKIYDEIKDRPRYIISQTVEYPNAEDRPHS